MPVWWVYPWMISNLTGPLRRSSIYPFHCSLTMLGAVARAYGVFDQQAGTCGRALFVIDADGIIRWSYLSPSSTNPGADGILNALEKLYPQNNSKPGG